MSCPLDCEYLLEAREHERFAEVDPKTVPNMDIEVSEEFMQTHDKLLEYLSGQLLAASLSTPGAVDSDIREALESMIKTYRTRQSGLVYESRPDNPIAAAIQQKVFASIEELTKAMAERAGFATLRDADVLGVIVFIQRVAFHWDTKRPRSRSLISMLLDRYGAPQQQEPAASSSLIVP